MVAAQIYNLRNKFLNLSSCYTDMLLDDC